MNIQQSIEKIIIDDESTSSDSLEASDVESLMQALVPNSELKQSTYYKEKEEFEVTSTIRRIEDIRKNVNQIKNINTTLEQLVKQYEVSMDSSQRLSLQRRISTVIQNGNSIAAASRFAIQTLKLEYNKKLRDQGSATTYNLFSQSYNTIVHSFVDYISYYQKLQKQYETLLEKNYTLPSFLEENSPVSTPIETKKQVVLGETVHHQLVEACLESELQYHEIEMIQKSMKEIQQLFFDLALLVDEQSEMLDYVQLNIDTTTDRTDRTETELRNSIKRMKKIRKLKCCIFVTLFILIIIAGISAFLFAKAMIFIVLKNTLSK